MALPETLEKNIVFAGRVEAGSGMEERERRRQRWIDCVRNLSEQCVLRCDETRSMEYRLETSVARIGANTTPTNKEQT